MATELEITKKRYQEIMGRTIDHKHKYNFNENISGLNFALVLKNLL